MTQVTKDISKVMALAPIATLLEIAGRPPMLRLGATTLILSAGGRPYHKNSVGVKYAFSDKPGISFNRVPIVIYMTTAMSAAKIGALLLVIGIALILAGALMELLTYMGRGFKGGVGATIFIGPIPVVIAWGEKPLLLALISVVIAVAMALMITLMLLAQRKIFIGDENTPSR